MQDSPDRKVLLLLALAVAIIGGAAWWGRTPAEPIYQGQRLSQWLYDNQGSVEDAKDMDTKAILWLAWAAEYGQIPPKDDAGTAPPPKFSTTMHEWWRTLFHRRFEADYDQRKEALAVLATNCRQAKPVIPVLLRLLADSDNESLILAAITLDGIGPDAESAIARAYYTASPPARRYLVEHLRKWPNDPDLALNDADIVWLADLAIKACADSDEGVRRDAASDLYDFWKTNGENRALEPSMPALIDLLASADPFVLAGAAFALEHFGTKAASAVPRLIELLDDPSLEVLEAASDALSEIDRVEKRSLPRLQELADGPEYDFRIKAARRAVYQLEHPSKR